MNNDNALQTVHSLLEAGRLMEAAVILSEAAETDDADALVMLAAWSVSGDIIPRNRALAYHLLHRATLAGHVEAALIYANFSANGIGCARNWSEARNVIKQLAEVSDNAVRQIALLSKMELDDMGNPLTPFKLIPHSRQPRLAVAPNFLTETECDYIVERGTPYLAISQVFDPQSGKLIPHPVRRSEGAAFNVYTEDLVISAVNRRIAALSGTDYKGGEPLQFLRYQRGDEYRPHLDALAGEPNQRILTVILYLSDSYSGGRTHFPRTGFSFKGNKGDALLFSNINTDGRPDQLSLHCGMPVTGGTKTIATRWIRQSPFLHPDPKPALDQVPGAWLAPKLAIPRS